MSEFAARGKCPHCREDFGLVSKVLEEQTLVLRMEWEGELMPARTIAGAIDNTRKLLEYSAREMGAKAQVHIASIEQREGSMDIRFLVMTKRTGKQGGGSDGG